MGDTELTLFIINIFGKYLYVFFTCISCKISRGAIHLKSKLKKMRNIVYLIFTITIAFLTSCSKDGISDENNASSFLSVTVNELNHSAVKLKRENLEIPKDSWLNEDIDFGGRSGIIIDNEFVYAPTSDGLAKINRENGNIAWILELCGFPEGNMILHENILFMGSDECFYAIDKNSGNSLWGKDIQNEISTTPVIIGNFVIITAASNGVYAFNIADGELAWFYSMIGGSRKSVPLHKDGKLYISGWLGGIHCLNPQTGEKIREICSDPQACSGIETSIMSVNDKLVFANSFSEVFAYEEDGSLLWRYKYPSPTRIYFKGIAYASGKIILTGRTNTRDDITICVDAQNGTLLWQFVHGDANKISHPIIVNESFVLVGSSNGLDNLNLNTGALIWNKKLTKGTSNYIHNQSTSYLAVTEQDIIYTTFGLGSLVRLKL